MIKGASVPRSTMESALAPVSSLETATASSLEQVPATDAGFHKTAIDCWCPEKEAQEENEEKEEQEEKEDQEEKGDQEEQKETLPSSNMKIVKGPPNYCCRQRLQEAQQLNTELVQEIINLKLVVKQLKNINFKLKTLNMFTINEPNDFTSQFTR